MKDLQSDAVVLELRMLGLVGKIITAPWMRMFYANEKNLTNLETTPAIQTSLQNLKYLKDNPSHALTTKRDIFDGQLSASDEVIKDLQRPFESQTEEAQFVDIFPKLMSGTIEVLERQLKPYLHGDLATPTVAQLEKSKSAPTHNIFAERLTVGRPPKTTFTEQHTYAKQQYSSVTHLPSKKRSAVPYNLQHCVTQNISLGK